MVEADSLQMTIKYVAKKTSRTTKQGYRHTFIIFNPYLANVENTCIVS
jgi:hypothetical protein